jgi:exosome complex component RRP45
LCILAGQRVSFIYLTYRLCPHCRNHKQVWHVRLTLHFLADAGNMLDCACLAGIVALKHFRRPDVEVIGDEVTVVRP